MAMKIIGKISLCALILATAVIAAPRAGTPSLQLQLGNNFKGGVIEENDLENESWLNRTTLLLKLDGELPHNLSYDASAQISEDRSSNPFLLHTYHPNDGLPYNVQTEKRRTWDTFTGSLQYSGGWLELSTGIDFIKQGPAERNPLLFSGAHAPWRPWHHGASKIEAKAPILHGTFVLHAGALSYTQTTGSLQHTVGYDKFFHNHRLQFRNERLTLGLGEEIIYGSTISTEHFENPADSSERSLMVGYTLPFIPYFFAEHYFGDRDNSAIYLDFSLLPFQHAALKSFEFYGEFLIDDLKTPTSLFDEKWWGNKWAWSGGIRNRHKGSIPWGWGWEYTRIEPWVGTHHKGGGYDVSHYGTPLGSDLGPNSQEHWFHIDFEPQIIGKISLFHSSVWKGSDRGSQIEDIHNYLIDGNKKKFLDPNHRIRWNEFGIEWNRSITPYAAIYGSCSHLRGEYKGWRGSIALQVGLRPL